MTTFYFFLVQRKKTCNDMKDMDEKYLNNHKIWRGVQATQTEQKCHQHTLYKKLVYIPLGTVQTI